jgi:hypothetical protein
LRNAFPDLKTYCVTSTKNRRGLDGWGPETWTEWSRRRTTFGVSEEYGSCPSLSWWC